MEIIGTGYSKDVKIGESFLQESVVSMWDFAPKGAFRYYSKGIEYVLQRYTRIDATTHNAPALQLYEVTEEMISKLREKHPEDFQILKPRT